MCDIKIFIVWHVWSHQSDFSGVVFIFSLPVNMTFKNNTKYIKIILLKDMSIEKVTLSVYMHTVYREFFAWVYFSLSSGPL